MRSKKFENYNNNENDVKNFFEEQLINTNTAPNTHSTVKSPYTSNKIDCKNLSNNDNNCSCNCSIRKNKYNNLTSGCQNNFLAYRRNDNFNQDNSECYYRLGCERVKLPDSGSAKCPRSCRVKCNGECNNIVTEREDNKRRTAARATAMGCKCFGGGLDCRRCAGKVYHAEMQLVSGAAYHKICFSCFCCRKPLDPLTYQEHYGEIFCKQCYIRNFGPQGYGYGMGAGVLQTPL